MGEIRPFKEPRLFHECKATKRVSVWIRRPSDDNRRHYIGYYDTFHMAARAQDRAILHLNLAVATNFKASDYDDDLDLRASMDETAFLNMLRDEARPKYNQIQRSACFLKFERMEREMEDLRHVTKDTFRQFMTRLAQNSSPNSEVKEAAKTLLDIFSVNTSGLAEGTKDSPSLTSLNRDPFKSPQDQKEPSDIEGTCRWHWTLQPNTRGLQKGKQLLRHHAPPDTLDFEVLSSKHARSLIS